MFMRPARVASVLLAFVFAGAVADPEAPVRRPWHPRLAWRQLPGGEHTLEKLPSAGPAPMAVPSADASQTVALLQVGRKSQHAGGCDCHHGRAGSHAPPADAKVPAAPAVAGAGEAERLHAELDRKGMSLVQGMEQVEQRMDRAVPAQKMQQPSPMQQQAQFPVAQQPLFQQQQLPAQPPAYGAPYQSPQPVQELALPQQYATQAQMAAGLDMLRQEQANVQQQLWQQQQQQQWNEQFLRQAPQQKWSPQQQQQWAAPQQQWAAPQQPQYQAPYQQPSPMQEQLLLQQRQQLVTELEMMQQEKARGPQPMPMQMQVPAPPPPPQMAPSPSMLRGVMMMQPQGQPMGYNGPQPAMLGEMPPPGVGGGWPWSSAAAPPPMYMQGAMQVGQPQPQQGMAYR